MTCPQCDTPPPVPRLWDPHRQAEPVRLWFLHGLDAKGEPTSAVIRARAQKSDRPTCHVTTVFINERFDL